MKNPAGVKLFADDFRSLPTAKGLSQQELADFANVEKSAIKRIEQAHCSPTLDVLISLCRALELELELELGTIMDAPSITAMDSDL